tara:strand:- start:560 stop:1711 length:1152 start_codon:yes stop_codon:yes gene_type:complete
MAFSFSDEQEEFRGVIRRFLEEKSPITEVRRLMEDSTGFDREVWNQINNELGLTGVSIPEAYGGHGFSFVELCIALEEMGRALFCAPFFASAVLGAGAILNGATEDQKKKLLPSLASGETIGTLAWMEGNEFWEFADITTVAKESETGFKLNGSKNLVLDGHIADLLIVAARKEGVKGCEGVELFLVDGNASGLERRPLKTVDMTRKLAALQFNDVEAELLGKGGQGASVLEHTLNQAGVAIANESVGGAQKVLETAVAYAKTRVQFGQPIGAFQAIKHKCADVLVDTELAKSAAFYAAETVVDDSENLEEISSLAKSLSSDAFLLAALENIQIHGGVGFTWEFDAHLYFRRAKASEVFLGTPTFHRERYARALGLENAQRVY